MLECFGESDFHIGLHTKRNTIWWNNLAFVDFPDFLWSEYSNNVFYFKVNGHSDYAGMR